ncbi:hypothetical protein BSL78_01061 [Apostichopus japonicus]|uniref:Uncharacterized protein n=1 Tax=Stichopus japonicus TaxID=307972 RepID=A0A2G8LPF0_STIJA|nr:hypothetical protein BSL78_01061 [Apostichopus japonicus]
MKSTAKTETFLSSVAVTKDVPPSHLHAFDRYMLMFASPFRHRKFAMCFLLSGVSMYVYSSWAIFLVSFGESVGFTPRMAVYLSSAGGIGGIAGSALAFLQFYFNRMNAVTGCLLPLVINGLSLLISVFSTSYGITLTATCISGFVQGYHYSALCGLMTTLLCQYHLRDGIAMTFLSEGMCYQFGGFFSGIVKDYFGSTNSVFLLNAVLSFAAIPFAVIWTLDKGPVHECYPKNQDSLE